MRIQRLRRPESDAPKSAIRQGAAASFTVNHLGEHCQGATWLSALIDHLFPAALAISGTSEFRDYAIEFTTRQFQISLWLAVITNASFGLWDLFGQDGGVMTTRFRFLVSCPIFVTFALAAASQFARAFHELYVLVFATTGLLIGCVTVILIDKELPFKINTGNATINFYLYTFFGFALLPFFVLNGLIFGLIAITMHSILLYIYSDAGLVVNSFYAFHIVVAVMVGMVVAYWRERFIRNDFRAKVEISQIRINNAALSAKILMSYRRADSDAMAGRIRDRLSEHFGEASMFMDIYDIPFGTDFRTHIANSLITADILIVVVGKDWLGARAGTIRRIDDENDPVRTEVEIALEHGIPLVPVLVSGAKMPEPFELPASIKEFAFRNAAEVEAGIDFRHHMERLIHSLDGVLCNARERSHVASGSYRPLSGNGTETPIQPDHLTGCGISSGLSSPRGQGWPKTKVFGEGTNARPL
jgi:TIR domain